MSEHGQPIGLSFSSLLPQFSYDLLARLVPGWLLITVGAVVLTSPAQFVSWAKTILAWMHSLGPLLGIFLIILLNLAAYLTATIVSGLVFWSTHSLPLSVGVRSMKKRQVEKAKPRAINQLREVCNEHVEAHLLPDFPVLYDGLRLSAPAAGARLTKTRAEYHMCRGLSAGFLLLAVLNVLIHDLQAGDTPAAWWRAAWELMAIPLLMIVTTPDVVPFPESWTRWLDRFGASKPWLRGTLVSALAVSLFVAMFVPRPLYEGATSAAKLEMVLIGAAVLFLYKSMARRQRFLEGLYNHWLVLRYEPYILRPPDEH